MFIFTNISHLFCKYYCIDISARLLDSIIYHHAVLTVKLTSRKVSQQDRFENTSSFRPPSDYIKCPSFEVRALGKKPCAFIK